MDEPCSALDPTSTNRIEETIREPADEVTIVIVTHTMRQATRVSDVCAVFLARANRRERARPSPLSQDTDRVGGDDRDDAQPFGRAEALVEQGCADGGG